MTADIQKLFNETIPNVIMKHGDAAKQIRARLQMNITGDGGGEWFIDLTDSGPSAVSGNPGQADCTITISAEDFQKLQEDPQAHAMQFFFSGKLKITGNAMLAVNLQKLLHLQKQA